MFPCFSFHNKIQIVTIQWYKSGDVEGDVGVGDVVGDVDDDGAAAEEGLDCGSRWALGINGPRQPVKQCRAHWRKAQIRLVLYITQSSNAAQDTFS